MRISPCSKHVEEPIDLTDVHKHASKGENDRHQRPNTTVVVRISRQFNHSCGVSPKYLWMHGGLHCLTAGGWPGQSRRTSPMCTPMHNGRDCVLCPHGTHLGPIQGQALVRCMMSSRAVGLGVRGPLAATTGGLHREKLSHWPNPEDHHRCWAPQRLDNV